MSGIDMVMTLIVALGALGGLIISVIVVLCLAKYLHK